MGTILRNKPIILIEIAEAHLNMYNKSTDDIVKFFKSISYSLKQVHDIDYISIPKKWLWLMQPKIDYEYGDYSYGVPRTNGEGILKIGKFCSIAEDVKFILWGHKTNLFSTYPFGHTAETKDMFPVNDHLVRGK